MQKSGENNAISYSDKELIAIFNRMGNLEAGKAIVQPVGDLFVEKPLVLLEHQREKIKKSPAKSTVKKYIQKNCLNRWYDEYISSLALLNQQLR